MKLSSKSIKGSRFVLKEVISHLGKFQDQVEPLPVIHLIKYAEQNLNMLSVFLLINNVLLLILSFLMKLPQMNSFLLVQNTSTSFEVMTNMHCLVCFLIKKMFVRINQSSLLMRIELFTNFMTNKLWNHVQGQMNVMMRLILLKRKLFTLKTTSKTSFIQNRDMLMIQRNGNGIYISREFMIGISLVSCKVKLD